MTRKRLLEYPFKWLDDIVETGLDPVSPATPEKVADWAQLLPREARRIQLLLKTQSFVLLRRDKIAEVVRLYQENIDELKRQAMVSMAAWGMTTP